MSNTTTPAALSALSLRDPLFAIEHVARLFLLEVDSAREFTYRSDFPTPIKAGRRWLWFREEVLAWAQKQRRYSTAERKRNTPTVTSADAPVKLYQARTKPAFSAHVRASA